MDGNWIDTAWKKVLTDGTDDAIAYFMPSLAAERDLSKEISILKDELPAIGSDNDNRMRVADICFSVPIKSGESKKVGFFVEQQHRDEDSFPHRMFQDFYRLSDSLHEKITALAIFTGDAKDRKEYSYFCFGVEVSFKYPTYHVRSKDIDELRGDNRAFAAVVLAARLMLEAGESPLNREKYARELLKIMRERDYDDIRKRFILDFVGRIFRVRDSDISPELRGEFMMQWIPISEARRELAIQDAKEEGAEEKAFSVARTLLARHIPINVIAEATGLNENDIIALR
jgi:hypothetical protein